MLLRDAAGVPVNASASASASYRALFEAGLIGAVALGGWPADKQAVRDKLRQRPAAMPSCIALSRC